MNEFKVNELIVYQNGPVFQIGLIKQLTEYGARVYYHAGCTTALTPYHLMHKLENACYIKSTSLGELDKQGEEQ